jgi:predicted esterase
MPELDGPRLEPRSGPARQLIVFLHGYGADGNDLIDIGRAWQGLLPHAAFVSPHAPEPCGQAPVGKQWFPLTFRDPNERWIGANKAAPVLQSFLDAELKRRNLPPSALALVGFSQGTMMALHVGLRRAVAPFAIVGYSGRRSCSSTATRTSSFRRRRCSRHRAGSPRSACRSSGTCPPASATASIRKGCATAASSSLGAHRRRQQVSADLGSIEIDPRRLIPAAGKPYETETR